MDAVQAVSHWYLNGKPRNIGKHSGVAAAQHAQFWSCDYLYTLSTNEFKLHPFVLALSRYMNQEKTANFKLLQLIASEAPETIQKAIRYSGLVLHTDSVRWKEVELLAQDKPTELKEFIRICKRFQNVYSSCQNDIKNYQKPLSDLTPLELLSYASLYAFQHLLSDTSIYDKVTSDSNNKTQEIWHVINDILVWKLQNSTKDMFHLTENKIGQSLQIHLSPFLFPSPQQPHPKNDLYQAFQNLVSVQLELNSFLSQSVDAFCYDDNIRFEFSGNQLIIKKLNPKAHDTWLYNGEKLTRLHFYWFYRALDKFAMSDYATQLIGKPENHEFNQLAIIKAMRSQLELSEVYGLSDFVTVEGGFKVDLFQALLSLELMTAFYNLDYVLPYQELLNKTEHWQIALGQLAMNGLLEGMQNRFPITWSARKDKAKNIKEWTVNKKFPKGNIKTAEAIIDFWCTNLSDLSTQLQKGQKAKIPELYERPFIEIGKYIFQLPWIVAHQNNSSSAINNLRRIGARRTESREETQRIEQRLSVSLKKRGFNVSLNYQPLRTPDNDPGEVDLICLRDNHLLVIEVKSTFRRMSLKDAWLHKTNTLRKAGLQLSRKVEAIKAELQSSNKLAQSLGVNRKKGLPTIHGWIIDTSIENDHEYFSGFLKVSLEEILIALRDDCHLLNDPSGFFSGEDIKPESTLESQESSTLYPNGFSGDNFIEVIKTQAVWYKNH